MIAAASIFSAFGALVVLTAAALIWANVRATNAMQRNEEMTVEAMNAMSRAEDTLRTAVAKIDKVYGEVKTLNTHSLANLADADEKRRILLLPREEWTPADIEFMEDDAAHNPAERETP